jgi:hypothetical protein
MKIEFYLSAIFIDLVVVAFALDELFFGPVETFVSKSRAILQVQATPQHAWKCSGSVYARLCPASRILEVSVHRSASKVSDDARNHDSRAENQNKNIKRRTDKTLGNHSFALKSEMYCAGHTG